MTKDFNGSCDLKKLEFIKNGFACGYGSKGRTVAHEYDFECNKTKCFP